MIVMTRNVEPIAGAICRWRGPFRYRGSRCEPEVAVR